MGWEGYWLPKGKRVLFRLKLAWLLDIRMYKPPAHTMDWLNLWNNRRKLKNRAVKITSLFLSSRSELTPKPFDFKSQGFSRSIHSLGKSVALMKKESSICQNCFKSHRLFKFLCSDSKFTQQLLKLNSLAPVGLPSRKITHSSKPPELPALLSTGELEGWLPN